MPSLPEPCGHMFNRMPQWFRKRSGGEMMYPDERWTAACPRSDAPLLLLYDHHTVWIGGRPALLRTYHWASAPLQEQPEPLRLEVSFTYAAGHPKAPATVQAIVDDLDFRQASDGPATGPGRPRSW